MRILGRLFNVGEFANDTMMPKQTCYFNLICPSGKYTALTVPCNIVWVRLLCTASRKMHACSNPLM